MLEEYLGNILYSAIIVIGMILIAKNLLDENFNKSSSKTTLIILIYILINAIVMHESFSLIQPFVTLILLGLSLTLLFDLNVTTTLVLSFSTITLAVLVSRLLHTSINIFGDDILSNNHLLNYMISLCSMAICCLISKLRIVVKSLKIFMNKINKYHVKTDFILLLLLIVTMLFFNYQLFVTRYIAGNGASFIIYIMVLIALFLIYVFDRVKYKDLIDRYDTLFEYACTFEAELEKDNLIRHEYHNQLAVIKDMTKDKRVITYIDDILNNMKIVKNQNIKGINRLPKGGLRGIIYYKIMCVKNNNISFSLDVSKNIKDKLAKLSPEHVKMISYVIGVCIDNAIDECQKANDTNISIEVYCIGKVINIVISNTIVDKVNIKRVGSKGYTTKGMGHGNGLFLIKRMLHYYKNISLNSRIINNYYVQEIKIML